MIIKLSGGDIQDPSYIDIYGVGVMKARVQSMRGHGDVKTGDGLVLVGCKVHFLLVHDIPVLLNRGIVYSNWLEVEEPDEVVRVHALFEPVK